MARTKGLLDSPSKQLMQDLIRDLEQVRLHNSELKRVKQYERRSFYERLDQIDREREEVHNAALSAAAAKRDQLRREAEETLHQHLRAAEEERRRKEEEERRRKEKIEREKAEKERREREEAARREAERKAREEQRRRQAEETERIRKAKEEAEKKAREEREERERLEQEKKKQEEERLKVQKEQEKKVAEQKRPEIREFLGETRRTPQEVTEHKRYLEYTNTLSSSESCSMIDILLAKYHVVCPVLWGFYGSESTQTGKTALGWWRDEPDGPFVSRQVHEERMIGLGAGFAAISLRDFSKTSRQNPLPNTHFWKALSIIVNVPPEEIQDTHLTVLGAMLKFSAQRVVGFWGDLGLLALRHAIVTFPSSLSKKSSARSSVEILRDLYAREHCILI
ncbi:hypothetical protein CIHG_09513 [Coccidioides immitis H538.4]|uniref:mRNA export factor GLE1 n=1 Tax=Coccidioides immitis H538.4 TaxID=396776 RepID=A0A0J8S4I3_COCIT|nr:hypothetical protein CIHG_09513 [Coccidioides immitis H538.4]